MAGLTHITPFTAESLLGNTDGLNNPLASTAWPAANRALYIPFRISQPIQMINGFVLNGGTASGNLDIGVYSGDGTKLCSTGSTAQAGTTTIQTIAFTTSPVIGPGLFFMALSCSATTLTFLACTTAAVVLRELGMFQQATAFALPATFTLASLASAYLPSMGVTAAAVV